MTTTAGRPVPVPDERSAPFWEAAARGELVLARCGACEQFVHPPEPVCPMCGSTEPPSFDPAPTRGVIRSWTVVHRSFLPGPDDDVPFVLVDVALDGTDDLRLIGRLVDGPDADLALGRRVDVTFEPTHDGDLAVPAFTLTRT